MTLKPIPQRWLDSGRLALGPGYWELTRGEPRAFVLGWSPDRLRDRDGRPRDMGVLRGGGEVG